MPTLPQLNCPANLLSKKAGDIFAYGFTKVGNQMIKLELACLKLN